MTDDILRLGRGDRLPNFVLFDPTDSGVMYYDKARGAPGVLVVHARTCPPQDDAEIGAIAARGSAFGSDGRGCELFILYRDAEPSPAPSGLPASAHYLRDPNGQVVDALSAAIFGPAQQPPVFALALDRNQRIVDIHLPGAAPAARQALDAALAADSAPRVEPAPVLVIGNLLEDAECDHLIAQCRAGYIDAGVLVYRDGQAFNTVDPAKKKRRDLQLPKNDETRFLLQKLGRRLSGETMKAFAFADFILEPPVVACYDSARADYFRAHRDNLNPASASRRFALSLNLNDGYDGGELIFAEFGGAPYRPPRGAGIVFSCSLVHEALPVTRGERFVFLTFLRDPQHRPHPWSLAGQGAPATS